MTSFIIDVIRKTRELNSPKKLIKLGKEYGSEDFFRSLESLHPFTFTNPKVLPDSTYSEKLVEFLGPLKIKVRTGDYAHPYKYVHDRQYMELSLKDYLSEFSAANHNGYAGNVKIDWRTFESLFPGISFKMEDFENPSIWIGPTGSITPLHVDGLDNISFQLTGSKRWLIVDPLFYDHLRMTAPFVEAPNLHVSELDLRASLAELDRLGVNYEVVNIEKGEGLYLPAGWSHFVLTTAPSIMVNLWANKKTSIPRVLL